FKFKFNPFSRNYVRSQGDPKYYAQAHPDEDFAETFAVWLTPRSLWRTLYKNWPALRKLEYIDRVMARIRSRKPSVVAGPLDSPVQSKTYHADQQQGRDSQQLKEKGGGNLRRGSAPHFNRPTERPQALPGKGPAPPQPPLSDRHHCDLDRR